MMKVELREVGANVYLSEILVRWELKMESCKCWDTSRAKFNTRTQSGSCSWLSD